MSPKINRLRGGRPRMVNLTDSEILDPRLIKLVEINEEIK